MLENTLNVPLDVHKASSKAIAWVALKLHSRQPKRLKKRNTVCNDLSIFSLEFYP
jgi:hypothetical protein